MLVVGGHKGQAFAPALRLHGAGAHRQNLAPEGGQAFVDPKQTAVHGLHVIGTKQAGRTSVFAVPGVNEFVGQQLAKVPARILLQQRVFFHDVVAGLVMFQSAEPARNFRQGNQPIVVGVMAAAEDQAGLLHQSVQDQPVVGRNLDGFGTLAGHVQSMGQGRDVFESARLERQVGHVLPHQQGGIYHGGEVGLGQVHLAADGGSLQGPHCLPPGRQTHVALDADFLAGFAFRIEQQFIPANHAQLFAGKAAHERELHVELIHARRHFHFEAIHLQRVALPLELLGTGQNVQVDHAVQRTGGAVLARQPFGVEQVHRPSSHRHLELYLKHASRRLGGIHLDLDGKGLSRRAQKSGQSKGKCGFHRPLLARLGSETLLSNQAKNLPLQ